MEEVEKTKKKARLDLKEEVGSANEDTKTRSKKLKRPNVAKMLGKDLGKVQVKEIKEKEEIGGKKQQKKIVVAKKENKENLIKAEAVKKEKSKEAEAKLPYVDEEKVEADSGEVEKTGQRTCGDGYKIYQNILKLKYIKR